MGMDMKTVMSVLAGLAIGYFAWQYLLSNSKGKIRGRLHKSATDKKLAGVCGGLAEYLNVDPTIIRVAWVLLVFGWGSGVLAYIVCAFVMPEDRGHDQEESE